jgi:hypothetical protein
MSDAPGAPGGAPAPQSTPADSGEATPLPPPSTSHNIPQRDGGEVSRGQPPSGEKRKSIEDSIKAAIAKEEQRRSEDEAKAKPEKPEAKPKAKTEPKPEPKAKPEPDKPARDRDEGGRFASSQPKEPEANPASPPARPGEPHHVAPTRFNEPQAKTDWATTPESVQREVHRMHRELEAGHQKYRADAEAFHQVRDYHEMATRGGTSLRQVLDNYVGIERDLVQGDQALKDQAIERVFQRGGINPREWAARLLNQEPEPAERAQFRVEQEVQRVERQQSQMVQMFNAMLQREQAQAISTGVDSFAKSNERFNELSAADVQYSIQNILNGSVGVTVDPRLPPQERLQKAYEIADRLNPATASSASLRPEPSPSASHAGTRSIAGPPSNGSDPSVPGRRKGERPSIHDSIQRARARLGA